MQGSIPVRSVVPVLVACLLSFLACASAAPAEAPAPIGSGAPAAQAAGATEGAAAASRASADPGAAAGIHAYLDSVYDPAEPGAAVLVSRAGETILRDAYGMADLELGVPLRPEHVFRIGSVTKQFTAVAILLLAQEGKLSLEDEITRFLPGYPTHGERITIEDLLHHTSGIRSYTGMPEYLAISRRDLALDSLIAVFRDEPPDFAPRQDWRYSNSGYVLLGKIIEEASGQEYAEFVHERIFAPLGMESSYYDSASRIIPNRARGYERTDDGWRNASYLSMTVPHAAGALLSTVDDLARWNRALGRGELVDPALLERAHTASLLPDGRSTGYGYGWMIGRAFGHASLEHSGGINGFLSYALHIPSEELFVAVLTNRQAVDPTPQQAAFRVAGIALGDTDELETASLPPEALREFVGVYRIGERETRITLEEGRLYSQRTGGEKYEMLPVAENEFVFPDTRTRVEFLRGDAGEVVRMHVRPRIGPEIIAERTAETVPSFDGVPIAYETHGGGALALVLVHGWSCDRSYWAAQIEPFSRDFQVVTVDLAGHGESGRDREAWTVEAFGADVAAVVESLALRRVILVGHSLGGDVILEAARLLPGRVEGLVWVDTYRSLGSPRTVEDIERFVAPFRTDFARAMDDLIRGSFPLDSDPVLVERVVSGMSAAPPEIAVEVAERSFLYGREVTDVVEMLDVPLVAINSEEPTDASSLERYGIEVVLMSGVGHFLMMEDPERFNALLRGVLETFAN